MNNKLKSKGFVFTISIIFFATTLVLFAQMFSSINLTRETIILQNFSPTMPPFINNNFSKDILEIASNTIDVNYYNNTITFSITGLIDNEINIYQDLVDYSSFLDNVFFNKLSGSQDLDLSLITDGNIEFISENFVLINNYDNNEFVINSQNTLNSIDLNLDFAGVIDSNEWVISSGNVSFNLFYVDDSNIISQDFLINPINDSNFFLKDGDEFILIRINNNKVSIYSNLSEILEYDLLVNYDYIKETFNLNINSFFEYISSGVYSKSLVKII